MCQPSSLPGRRVDRWQNQHLLRNLLARTEGRIPVRLAGDAALVGSIVPATVTAARPLSLAAELSAAHTLAAAPAAAG